MNHPLKRLGVIGAGAWGTALAAQSAAQGKAVILAAREADVAASINNTRENAFFLKGVPLPAGITAVTDNAAALDTQAVLLVTPSQFLRAT
ncbi:MAG: NAD(P)-binding domain-containing protein, partial [Rhodospirillales bacterium]